MEHHRLKPMKDGYDEKLFNELYKKTQPLRKSLAYQIDARKFGVDYNEIMSWFDVKFIHAFNKYHDTQPERLMGYIINALSTYKYRIMRSSYQAKYHNKVSTVDITELYNVKELSNIDYLIEDNEEEINSLYFDKAMSFLKGKLSDNALLVLEIELNPPPFVLDSMDDLGKKESHKIPNSVIADYLGFDNSPNTLNYIRDTRAQVKQAIALARQHFSQTSLA